MSYKWSVRKKWVTKTKTFQYEYQQRQQIFLSLSQNTKQFFLKVKTDNNCSYTAIAASYTFFLNGLSPAERP